MSNNNQAKAEGPFDCPECGAPGQLFDDAKQVGCHNCGHTWTNSAYPRDWSWRDVDTTAHRLERGPR